MNPPASKEQEKAIVENKELMAQISPAMKLLHENPDEFWKGLIPYVPRKERK